MKTFYRRSKHISALGSLPQLFVLAGVILISGIVFSPSASAKTEVFALKSNVQFNALEENDKKIDALQKNFKLQKEKVDDALKSVEQVKEETAKIAQEKQTLADEVANVKSEVEALKAKVEEKKRLEALRIMPAGRYASDAGGNLYAAGNCTWYVKQRRPDIGNQWGNANMWLSSAQANGFLTGSSAKVGAIGVSFEGWAGHVVYVESVDGDMVTISEMNYGGLYRMNTRTVHQSNFSYIYQLV